MLDGSLRADDVSMKTTGWRREHPGPLMSILSGFGPNPDAGGVRGAGTTVRSAKKGF
jgi:hypothetical protein